MHRTRTLHCYDYIDRPYERIRLVFAGECLEVLQHATDQATSRAIGLSTQLHTSIGALEIGAPVTIDITRFEQSAPESPRPSCRLRLSWKADRGASLFPSMEADLEAHPVTEQETQLALFGTYRPPLGVLGLAADALVGHHVAEASIHRFMRELVQRLQLAISGG